MSSVEIDPTAIVDSKAELGAGTIVGPYCIIASGVLLGEKCWLQHHVTLAGPMRGGRENRFYAYCSIGQQTQDLKYAGEPTYLEIGDDGCEVDTGERVWNAHVQGARLAFRGDVTVTLEGGQPMPARVAYGDALMGQGVPSHAGATTP